MDTQIQPVDKLPDTFSGTRGESEEEQSSDVDGSGEVTEETLVSLFKINKHAREYAERSQRHYWMSNYNAAKRNSYRKEALYSLKGKVLDRLEDEADRIEMHRIDGQAYYCLYFDGWSFHCELSEIDQHPGDIEGETKKLGDFEKDSDTGDVTRSLKASLLHLQEEFGLDANDFLPGKKVGGYFAGWKYL